MVSNVSPDRALELEEQLLEQRHRESVLRNTVDEAIRQQRQQYSGHTLHGKLLNQPQAPYTIASVFPEYSGWRPGYGTATALLPQAAAVW